MDSFQNQVRTETGFDITKTLFVAQNILTEQSDPADVRRPWK